MKNALRYLYPFIFISGVLFAVFVIFLRSLTYSVGYDIAQLKKEEAKLKIEHIQQTSKLAFIKIKIRKALTQKTDFKNDSYYKLPKQELVIHKNIDP
jgi:hypothetical protein